MIVEIKGAKVVRVKEEQTFGSGFNKQEVIVETDEKYPQQLPVEFVKEMTSTSAELAEGDTVDLDVAVNGREWIKDGESQDRWFLSLKVINCEVTASEPVTKKAAKKKQEAKNKAAVEAGNEVDDLPF